jgi:hypothetical protein
MVKKITGVKVLENYRVHLRFDDGVEGEVDFSKKPRIGVYAAWADYANVRKARVGDCGELVWDNELDFSADSLWLQVTGQKSEAVLDSKSQTAHA